MMIFGAFLPGKAITISPSYLTTRNIFFTDSSSLYFNFFNTNFVWDDEFFNDIYEGYTLIGYFLTPQLEYHFTPNLKADVGVHLLKYSGINSYSSVIPTYSVTYHTSDFALIMGNIYGTINHRLPEPMMFHERFFTHNLENGVQTIINKERFYADAWVDWLNFIFPNDAQQEKLTGGISTEISIIKNKGWDISIPASSIISHQGGQIDTSSAHMKTLLNSALGLRLSKELNYKILDKASFDVQYINFIDNSPTIESLYPKGRGVLSKIKLGWKDSFFELGYWKAHQYLSMLGNPLYQCVSEKSTAFNKTDRELLTAQLFYSKTIYNGIYLGLTGATYYDIRDNYLDYAVGLTLIIKNNFLIHRFNSQKPVKVFGY